MNHTGLFPSVTVSFNLAPGVSLGPGDAGDRSSIQQKLGMPQSVHGEFSGTLRGLPAVARPREPYLMLTAILAVYIVLGILYESLVHPDHDSLHASAGERGRDSRAAAHANRSWT